MPNASSITISIRGLVRGNVRATKTHTSDFCALAMRQHHSICTHARQSSAPLQILIGKRVRVNAYAIGEGVAVFLVWVLNSGGDRLVARVEHNVCCRGAVALAMYTHMTLNRTLGAAVHAKTCPDSMMMCSVRSVPIRHRTKHTQIIWGESKSMPKARTGQVTFRPNNCT